MAAPLVQVGRDPLTVEERHAVAADPDLSAVFAILRRGAVRAPSESLAAEIAGVSVATIRRRFHTVLGRSFRSVLLSYRMMEAEAQLAATGDKISVVARKAGYRSAAAFDRAWGRQHKINPIEWRRLARARH